MNGQRKRVRTVAVVTIALTLISDASANVGLPMIAVTLPAMVVALIPLIALEGWLLVRDLGVAKMHALKMTAVANIVSTVVGIPLSWFVLLLLQLTLTAAVPGVDVQVSNPFSGTLHAAWIPGYLEIPTHMVAGATAVLLIPFCVASCLIEYEVIWRWFIKRPHELNLTFEQIRHATIRANLASYTGLAIITVAWWISAL